MVRRCGAPSTTRRAQRTLWGSAVIARSLELEEPEPDGSLPWQRELRGSVAVARTSGDPTWLASVHAFTKPISESRLQAHPTEDLIPSAPDGTIWETDLVPLELRRLFGEDTSIWGGDLNSAVIMDSNPSFVAGRGS